MTFRDFIERALGDFEEHLRREAVEDSTLEMRLRGAGQFARLLLGEPLGRGERQSKGDPSKGDPSTRRFGGPK